jgi:hypothetical protein
MAYADGAGFNFGLIDDSAAMALAFDSHVLLLAGLAAGA